MSAVSPTPKRIASMDVLRGIAVLGILLANISYFCHPMAESLSASFLLHQQPDEAWAAAIREAFVSGKMRSLLAMLFGAGLWMQFEKLSAADLAYQREVDHGNAAVGRRRLWPNKYLRRTAYLLILGLCHGIFIWHGDILFLYALCAFAAIKLVQYDDKIILWIIAAGILYGLCVGIALAFSTFTGSGTPGQSAPFLSAASELQVYTVGSYITQVEHRSTVFVVNLINLVLVLPSILAMFLGGMLLARRGIFQGSHSSERDIRNLMKFGLGAGIPLNLLPLALRALGQPPYLSMLVEECFAPIAAFGLLGLFLTLAPRMPSWLTDPFGRVGRVALTTYLLQSVICTTLCYSWGFELYGKISWKQELFVVSGVWVACLVFARFWTKQFSIGPVEWAWRSMVEGKALPWREVKAEPHEALPQEAV